MIWDDMIWFDMMIYDMIWYDIICDDMIWYERISIRHAYELVIENLKIWMHRTYSNYDNYFLNKRNEKYTIV